MEGCPAGLKSLYVDSGSLLQSLEPLSVCIGLESLNIWNATQISDLSPLATCTRLKKLRISHSKVTDISALSSLSQLEDFDLGNASVTSLAPLSHCKNLKTLQIRGNPEDITLWDVVKHFEVVHSFDEVYPDDSHPMKALESEIQRHLQEALASQTLDDVAVRFDAVAAVDNLRPLYEAAGFRVAGEADALDGNGVLNRMLLFEKVLA